MKKIVMKVNLKRSGDSRVPDTSALWDTFQGKPQAASRVSPTDSSVGCNWEAIGVKMSQPFGAHSMHITLVCYGIQHLSWWVVVFLWSYLLLSECGLGGGSEGKVLTMQV